MLGYTEEELRELSSADIIHPSDRAANKVQQDRLIECEIPSFEIVSRYLSKEGNILWGHRHLSLLRNETGRPTHIMALVTNITERKQHEDQVSLLMREVNHRSKHMLSVVQAIARQTAAATPGDFIERFGQRIQALAAPGFAREECMERCRSWRTRHVAARTFYGPDRHTDRIDGAVAFYHGSCGPDDWPCDA